MDSNYNSIFYKSVFYTFVSKYSSILINIITTAILARILTPKDFGVVAIVTVFINFFQLLSQMGIAPAIIQNRNLTRKDISNIYKFSIFISICFGVIFFLFSNFISNFFDNELYIFIGRLLSISVVFNSLSTVPTALILKNKKFKLNGIIIVISTLVSGIASIVAAAYGATYYSIVIKAIIYSVLAYILNLIFSDIKLENGFDFKGIKSISEYSLFQFFFNLVNYFSRNLDNILIGKFIGPMALGFYDKAYTLMLYPIQNLTHVITPVMHPILSEYQENKLKIFNSYKKITKILSLIGIPITIILFFYSEEIILLFYGDQWISINKTFSILSLSIIFQIVLSSSGAIFQSAGRPNTMFFSSIISTILIITGVGYGIIKGSIEYVAIGITASMILNFFQTFYFLIVRVLEQKLSNFLSSFLSSILIGCILTVINLVASGFIETNYIILDLTIGVILNLIVWLTAVCFLGEYKFLKLDIAFIKLICGIKKIVGKVNNN